MISRYSTGKKAGMVILYASIIIALIVFAPFATIASLNTLFALNIPYTFYTWLSTVWLGGFIARSAVSKSK